MSTPLWLRSVRQRPLTAALLCLLSAVAVLTSVLGPILVQAVQQSTLSDALDAAGPLGRSLSASGQAAEDDPWDPVTESTLDVIRTARSGPASTLWSAPRLLVNSSTLVVWKATPDAVGTSAVVTAVDGDCRAYRLTAGRCPSRPGQVLVSSADARRDRLTPGATITFTLARAPLTRVKVVGLYDGTASPAAGLARPGTADGVQAGVQTDPLILTSAQASALPLAVVVTTQMTLRADLTTRDLPALQQGIDRAKATANAQDQLVAAQTSLSDVLDRVSTQARSAEVLILVTDVQALFLAIFALTIVLQRIGRARAAEWSVGRLRGVPRGRWYRSIYAEPLVVVVVGLPLGFLAGIAVARWGVALTLRPGTPIEPWRWPVALAAVAATVFTLAALVVVSLRSIRQPLAELVQQQAESRRLGTVGAVLHAGVFLLAAATLYQLVTGGVLSSSKLQLGLLAPGLLALAVALAAVRVAVLTVSRVTTRAPRTLSALVVGRHAARTPSSLNPAMIIAVGLALAVFATQVYSFSTRNQALRADAVTGASTVLTVAPAPGVDLTAAVRAADPGGRQAMAVKETAVGQFSGDARIVAVDSSRLAAVTSWSPSWSGVPDLASALRGPVSAPVVLRGSHVQVDLTEVRVTPQKLATALPTKATRPQSPPALVLTLETAGRWQTVNLGPVAAQGSGRRQRLSGDLPCAAGCRIAGLGLLAAQDAPYKGTFVVSGVSTDQQPVGASASWLRGERRWRQQSVNETIPTVTSLATPKGTTTGLWIDAFDTQGGGLTSVSPSDTADPLPAVLAPRTQLDPVQGSPSTGFGTGLDGQQQKLQVLGHAKVLPRSLDDGVLVDLTNAQGLSDPAKSQAVDEVWLASGPSADLERRLAAQGLTVQSRELLSTTRDELRGQATTRGAAAAVIVSSAALALALLALLVARWADAGRRGADWLALREGGVSPRRLRGLVRVEIAVPAVIGVVVGLLSGAVAARIAGSRLPLVDLAAPGPPLDLRLSWTPMLLLGAGTVLVVLVVAQVAAWSETRVREQR